MIEPKVKICGIRKLETIHLLKQLPVDYVGFVFAESKRKVSPEDAAELIGVLRQPLTGENKMPQAVGVFVNPSLEQLDEIQAKCALDVIQLHGNETPEFCQTVKQRYNVKVFKVFSIRNESDTHAFTSTFEPYAGVIDVLMLDTYDPVYGGGSGKPFRWSLIPQAADWCKQAEMPLFVAGGLDASNVRSLLDQYAPGGVDISSGVETDGEKDEDKITQFVGRVKVHEHPTA